MKKTNIELTVFTPTYNHENYIEECINGIISQKTTFKFKLLIADDFSNDKTREIIERYQKKYPKIIETIFREKNLGPMDNFIQSLNTIHTKYVALCDGDDFWIDKNKLQKQYDFLENNKDFSLCFHQTNIFYEDKSRDSIIHPCNIKNIVELEDILNENNIVANSVVYRWKYIEENSLIKEFPKNIVPGDYFLNIMHIKIGKGYFIEEVMSKYRKQESGMWYLQSNPETQNEFYIKYGERYLKFYKSIEKLLNLSSDRLKPQKNWIVYHRLVAYIKTRKFLRAKLLFFSEFKSCKESYNDICANLLRKDKIFFYSSISIFYLLYQCILKMLKNKNSQFF